MKINVISFLVIVKAEYSVFNDIIVFFHYQLIISGVMFMVYHSNYHFTLLAFYQVSGIITGFTIWPEQIKLSKWFWLYWTYYQIHGNSYEDK